MPRPSTEPIAEQSAELSAAQEAVDDVVFADDLREVAGWVTAHCRPAADHLVQEGLEVVEILRALAMDKPGLIVGLLQSWLPVGEKEQALIAAQLDAPTVTLLRGVGRLRQLSALSQYGDAVKPKPKQKQKISEENLRKMLLAMIDDARVVLIELACHLARLRRCKRTDLAKQSALGRLTLEVYAPLANRLGVRQLKWQMEDYALRYLAPQEYLQLAAMLDEKRIVREQYNREFIHWIQAALRAAGLRGEVHGRAKHLYSIWKKMQRKGVAFEKLQDLQAVRILTDHEADCYAALALLSDRWQPLPAEFDDYIATPKDNGYRSIHTVLVGPQGKHVEVQIRTREMHRQSELGVAAHWRYKEAMQVDEDIDHKILRLRQLLQWKEELHERSALAEYFPRTAAAAAQRVYAFTPNGTVIDLPAGATPIDFAYAIHSEVGHCIRGAQVNGNIAPLGHALQTGDQVYIQTLKGGHPSRDWLRHDLGYIRTRRARDRISQWFKKADYARHLAAGRGMLERELSRRGMEHLAYDHIARHTHFHKTDDMLAAIGAHDFKLSKALAPFRGEDAAHESGAAAVTFKPRRRARPQLDNFQVEGVRDLLTRIAKCCKPIRGDPIVGFITAGRGVSIHRRNCKNIQNLGNLEKLENLENPENLDNPRRARIVQVQWGEAEAADYAVELYIVAHPHRELLNDVTQFFMQEKIEVIALKLDAVAENNSKLHLKLQISDVQQLDRVMKKLASLSNVLQVHRVMN